MNLNPLCYDGLVPNDKAVTHVQAIDLKADNAFVRCLDAKNVDLENGIIIIDSSTPQRLPTFRQLPANARFNFLRDYGTGFSRTTFITPTWLSAESGTLITTNLSRATRVQYPYSILTLYTLFTVHRGTGGFIGDFTITMADPTTGITLPGTAVPVNLGNAIFSTGHLSRHDLDVAWPANTPFLIRYTQTGGASAFSIRAYSFVFNEI